MTTAVRGPTFFPVKDTGDKLFTGVNDTGDNLLPVR
jgi:hypothetical protein